MGYITDMSKYHNAGIRSMDLHILRFVYKIYDTFGVCSDLPLIRNKLLGAPAFVKLTYCNADFRKRYQYIHELQNKKCSYRVEKSSAHHN